ncbi:MAG: type II and III secretion system protein, partial [Deltaproteobacteria bacterium]|nr:type II and III secretion system protein [Deltaproteobacteria bacterium]
MGGAFRSQPWVSGGQANRLYLTPGGSSLTGQGTNPGEDPVLGGDYIPTYGRGVSGQGMGLNFPGMDPTAQGLGSAGLGLGLLVGAIGGNILEVQLSALQEQNKLNILSSPSITTMDNQMAFTENGERVPYVSYDDGDKEVKFEDAVLRLEITPHVIDEKYLRMDILIKK